MHRKAEAFREWAREPKPFDPPAFPMGCPQLAADWAEAERMVKVESQTKAASAGTNCGRLQHATMDLLRSGCPVGERHTRLFRAAGNMAEYDGTHELIHAVLDEVGADLGLPLAEVRRQVDCGIERTLHQRRSHKAREEGGAGCTQT